MVVPIYVKAYPSCENPGFCPSKLVQRFALIQLYLDQFEESYLISFFAFRPQIELPRPTHYKTMVSLDAGAIRCLISVLVLIELEDSIKRYILNSKADLLPKDASISSIQDFDVILADFIDCFAGTSSGSWSVLYLSSRGQTGGASNVLSEKNIIDKYGVLTPGSARALVVFFKEYVKQMFPAEVFANTAIFNPGTDPSTPGVNSPRMTDKVFVKSLRTWFGDTKLSDLHTSCFVPSFDLVRRSKTLFVHDKLASDQKVGFTQVIRRNQPRSRNESFFPDVEGHYGVDFYLRDIAYASASGISVTPEKELNPIDEPGVRLILADGNLYKSNPVFPALIHIANSTEDTSFSRIAVLSIGTGAPLPDSRHVANGGIMQWEATLERLNYAAILAEEALTQQLKFFFASNSQMKPGQFSRIQAFGAVGSNIYKTILESLLFDNWDDVENLGLEVGHSNRLKLDFFVKEFVFV
eukprot:g4861.t1